MTKLIQLTDNSWLIKDQHSSGLLFKNSNSYELLTENERRTYSSFEEVEKRYRKFVKDTLVYAIETQKIKGFNVRHKGDLEIVDHEELPLYTKSGSKIVFVGGWWLLNFVNSSGWTLSYSPKLSTVENNESEGPFHNRLEALNRISILNSKKD